MRIVRTGFEGIAVYIEFGSFMVMIYRLEAEKKTCNGREVDYVG